MIIKEQDDDEPINIELTAQINDIIAAGLSRGFYAKEYIKKDVYDMMTREFLDLNKEGKLLQDKERLIFKKKKRCWKH